MKHLTFILVFISFSATAQIQGVVKNSEGRVVSYTNIWIENEEGGCTTGMDGRFILPQTVSDKTLIVYACGYEEKRVKGTDAAEIILISSTVKKEERINTKKGVTTVEVNDYKEEDIKSSFNPTKTPLILAKYFAPEKNTKEQLYIKNITASIITMADNAKIRLRFFSVKTDGTPGNEINTKEIITTIPKGARHINVALEKYNIAYPQEGIFAAIEWLWIDENNYKQDSFKSKKGIQYKGYTTYMPIVAMLPSKDALGWEFAGKWIQQGKMPKAKKNPFSEKYAEMAMKITLTD